MNANILSNTSSSTYITTEDVKQIVSKYLKTNCKDIYEYNYSLQRASEKMLGFLSDYWKLKVFVDSGRKELCFFIKAISRYNEAKAEMVKEFNLYNKELCLYSEIKRVIHISDLKPWSAALVDILDDAMVFEDMNALNYQLCNKFHRFDMQHTLQALNTMTRLHASSIIYEEKRSKELKRTYRLDEDFGQYMDKAGYSESSSWYLQCMIGALKAINAFVELNNEDRCLLESRWSEIWFSALELSSPSPKYRNVICHRDLWNNNLLFHYNDKGEPDDCVFVDFQAIRYQPPAGDVMLLLCCNLDPKFREEHLNDFLNHYYEELRAILHKHEVIIEDILTKDDFLASANEQRQWGLVVCACLLPQIWIDDDLTTEIFCNTERYDDILSKNKAAFIIKMMEEYPSYKEKVMEIFIEIVARYGLHP